MSFFDSKEEMLNIELTPYGRHLLSKGKFKPVYYAFYDDDILYDAAYIGITESKNEIEPRILDNTPINKPQYNFSSLEQALKLNTYIVQTETEMNRRLVEQDAADKNYALSLPLGKSSHNSIYAPAWNISFLSGAIKTFSGYLDNTVGTVGSLQPYQKIPQITIENVNLFKQKSIDEPLNIENQESSNESRFVTTEIIDNKEIFHYYKPKYILIDVIEENVDDLKQNFDIQMFIEEEKEVLQYNVGLVKTKFWKELTFFKNEVFIENNILLDNPILVDEFLRQNPNKDNSELYYDITVDNEIELPPEFSSKLRRGIFNITYTSNNITSSVAGDCT